MPTTEVSTWTLEECAEYCDVIEESYSEMLAEAGSSAFMLYGNADDANSVAHQEVRSPQQDSDYVAAKARLQADRDVRSLIRVIQYDPTDIPF